MDRTGVEARVVHNYLTAGQNGAAAAEPDASIAVMQRTWHNPAYRPLASHRKIGPLIIFVKKIIRKFLFKWYADPVCNQQTEFNAATMNATTAMHTGMSNFYALLQNQGQELVGVSGAIDELKNQHNQWSHDINDALTKHVQWIAELNKHTQQHEPRTAALEQRLLAAEAKLERLETYGVFSDKHLTYEQRSFSQSGEDLIISIIFLSMRIPLPQVSYLDLGANHAKEISNTYYFYRLGARGVLVEANPALIPELKLYRNGDVVINKCIAEQSGETVPFYVIGNGDGLSTPVKEDAEAFIQVNPTLSLERVVDVETISVMDIAEQYFNNAPLLLNVDIEGKEEEILRSIDFERCRPAVIVCEMIPYIPNVLETIGKKNQKIAEIMQENDYVEYAFTGINAIFVDNKRLQGACER